MENGGMITLLYCKPRHLVRSVKFKYISLIELLFVENFAMLTLPNSSGDSSCRPVD